MIKKHPLTEEFPEFADKIHELKVEDEDFKELYNEYDELDHEIYNIEAEVDPTSDEVLNQLRIERLRIKDEIYEILKGEEEE